MRTIIAISGKQRAGKDTLAAALVAQFAASGRLFVKAGLADALKVEWGRRCLASHGEGMAPAAIIAEVDALKNSNGSVRASLIEYGQSKKVGNPPYWVDRVLELPGDLIISDLRYWCEIERLRELEAAGECRVVLVRVECPRETRALRGTLSNESDPSETELDHVRDWDALVHNDGVCSIDAEAAFVCRMVTTPGLALHAIPV